MRNLTETERFFLKIDRSGPIPAHRPDLGACHVWTASLVKGYGQHFLEGKTRKAHRIAFCLEHGRWPEPFCCHHCDNPACVNPAHLFEGTAEDNAKDREAKSRGNAPHGDIHYTKTRPHLSVRAERHGRSKLKNQDVRDIVAQRLLCRVSNAEIARQRSLSPATVDNIMSGRNWSSVTGISRKTV